MDHNELRLNLEAQASIPQRKLNAVRLVVLNLIDFIVTSFEELGIERLHELADPSLDDLEGILVALLVEAKQLDGDNINLQQAILMAQIMVNDIKLKNPDLCSNSAKILKTVSVD